jgi:hypothetical protein
MEHTRISRERFESEVAALPIFGESGGNLGAERQKFRFKMETVVGSHEYTVHYRITRRAEHAPGSQVGHSFIYVEFGRDRDGNLFRPQPRLMLATVCIDSFTPEPLLSSTQLPEKEAATFGERRAHADAASQRDDASHEQMVFALALNEILGAIERAVIA